MSTTIKTAPASEPVTLTEAKAHLRVTGSGEDTLITTLIKSCRRYVEQVTNRALITQTWYLYLDAFPASDIVPIRLPYPTLQSVTSVSYVDTDGNNQTWDSSNYDVDTDREPGIILPKYNVSYPSTRDHINVVTVEYVCGYGGSSAVPEDIKHAILLMIGHLFENREQASNIKLENMPIGVYSLLAPYRMWMQV